VFNPYVKHYSFQQTLNKERHHRDRAIAVQATYRWRRASHRSQRNIASFHG